MTPDETLDTKSRILDAAERLFSCSGFAATSLRNITTEAGVNLAAANYHFGSKEALIKAVLQRRIGPLNKERLRLLEAAGANPPLERIVEAFVGPALRLRMSPDGEGRLFMRLLGHAVTKPDDQTRQLMTDQFREVFQRFSEKIHAATPELTREEVDWRFLFMVGSMAYTMAMAHDLERLSDGLCSASDDVDVITQRMVPFLVAGFKTPAPSLSEQQL